ncbi:MAG: hypothetical protein LBP73_09060 [Clostridiales Family XIII bacterium]|nr:hypothetical protein [Clostridiales Family XIII bacterium]
MWKKSRKRRQNTRGAPVRRRADRCEIAHEADGCAEEFHKTGGKILMSEFKRPARGCIGSSVYGAVTLFLMLSSLASGNYVGFLISIIAGLIAVCIRGLMELLRVLKKPDFTKIMTERINEMNRELPLVYDDGFSADAIKLLPKKKVAFHFTLSDLIAPRFCGGENEEGADTMDVLKQMFRALLKDLDYYDVMMEHKAVLLLVFRDRSGRMLLEKEFSHKDLSEAGK